LAAGADPRRPSPAELYGTGQEDWPDWTPAHAAIQADCPIELVRLLLEAGADPKAKGPDGRTPRQLAARHGRADLGDWFVTMVAIRAPTRSTCSCPHV
jgi:ankyrin repeat protein